MNFTSILVVPVVIFHSDRTKRIAYNNTFRQIISESSVAYFIDSSGDILMWQVVLVFPLGRTHSQDPAE
jgi:hypothetical protein